MSYLEQFLVSQIFTCLIIFSRVGSGIMVLPGFGESYVNPRSRLMLALAIAVLLTPVMEKHMPVIPDSPVALLTLLVAEILVGVAIGLVCRFIIAALHVAGMIIAYNSSLALATQFDYTQSSQGSLIGNFLSISAVVLLFTMDLHYVMLRGLADSYTLFTPGMFPPMDDMSMYFATLVSEIFSLGVRIASPSIVIGLFVYLGAGILARLMPSMQVFFVLMPVQIFLGLFVLAAILTSVMLEFSGFFEDHFAQFLKGEM